MTKEIYNGELLTLISFRGKEMIDGTLVNSQMVAISGTPNIHGEHIMSRKAARDVILALTQWLADVDKDIAMEMQLAMQAQWERERKAEAPVSERVQDERDMDRIRTAIADGNSEIREMLKKDRNKS